MSLLEEVEALAARIMNTPVEEWNERNAALHSMKALVESYEGRATPEIFNINVFRAMKEPIKSLIADLRSAQVRDCCDFLRSISRVCGDQTRLLMREVQQTVMEQLKVPNKVTCSYVDETLLLIIQHTKFPQGIALFCEGARSRNKSVREPCLEYIHQILVHWDNLKEKDVEIIQETIIAGVEDASARARDNARLAYVAFVQRYPQQAEAILKAVRPGASKLLLAIKEKPAQIRARKLSVEDHVAVTIQALYRGSKARRESKSFGMRSGSYSYSESSEGELSPRIHENGTSLIVKYPATGETETPTNILQHSYIHSNTSTPPHTNTSTPPHTNSSIPSHTNSNIPAHAHSSISAYTNSSMPANAITNIPEQVTVPPVAPIPKILASLPSSSSQDDMIGETNSGHEVYTRRRISVESNASITSHMSIDDSLKPEHVTLNQRVVYLNNPEQRGVVRYIGHLHCAMGFWVGMELDEAIGKNDGTVKGQTYFTCSPNHGLFCKPSQVQSEEEYQNRLSLSKYSLMHRNFKIYIGQMMDSFNTALSLAERFDNVDRTQLTQELQVYTTTIRQIRDDINLKCRDFDALFEELSEGLHTTTSTL